MIAPRLAAVALIALVTACAGTDPDEVEDVAVPVVPATPPAAAPAEAAPMPEATVIEATYAGGEVTGVEPRVEVEGGEQVVLRVTSDVAEQIHVHGYDLYVDIPAGGTGEVAFVADLPGAYEVELHDAGRPLFQLRVS